MLTYLRSHSCCSGSSKGGYSRGFSLIELLIVTAITALISTIVVVRFSTFDSTVLLKSLAYEIAVSVREAQVYSLSVLGSAQGFDTPYGMSFTPNSKQYVFFQYLGDFDDRPRHDSDANDLNTFNIGRSLEVFEICAERSGQSPDCSLSRLDVSFRRPSFDALFFAVDEDGDDWTENQNDDIVRAQIKARSLTAEDVWTVEVSLLGQITVYKESS